MCVVDACVVMMFCGLCGSFYELLWGVEVVLDDGSMVVC